MFHFSFASGEVYIRDAPQHQRVRAGSPMRMHCTAGTDMLLFGIPVIDWEQDDEPINFAKDRRFKMDASDNSLRLTNTSTTDTGVYTCVATLEQERASASATLIVEGQSAIMSLFYADIFFGKYHGDQWFVQFKIIINVLVSSFRFIWMPMLWVYGHHIFIRQNLTSTDRRQILTYKVGPHVEIEITAFHG